MTDNNATICPDVNDTSPNAPTRILRLPEVMRRVGLKRASIYSAIAEGSFPKQIVLNARAVGWIEQEIEDWLIARVNNSRQKQGLFLTSSHHVILPTLRSSR